MTKASPASPEVRAMVLNEVLKGERPLPVIADELGFHVNRIRDWLRDHYAANPEDTRHHLVMRHRREKDPQGGEAGEAVDGGADDSNAREDMAKRGTKKPTKKNRGGHTAYSSEVKNGALADLDGGMSLAEAEKKYGVHQTTLSIWRRRAQNRALTPRDPKAYAQAVRLMKEGWSPADVARKLGVATSAISAWWRNHLEHEQGPGMPAQPQSGQLALMPPEQTMVSSGNHTPQPASYQPRSSIMPMRGANVDEAMVEANRQLLDERSALRGFVDILTREKESLVKENDALRRQLAQQLGRV